MRVLGSTLCRVKQTNMSVSWSWALATLGCHLRTAHQPPNLGLEGAERLSADQGEEAAQLLELCGACEEMVGGCNVFKDMFLILFVLSRLRYLFHTAPNKQTQRAPTPLTGGRCCSTSSSPC